MIEIIQIDQKKQTTDKLSCTAKALAALDENAFHRCVAWDEDLFVMELENPRTKLLVLIDSEDASQSIQGYCLYEQRKKKIDIGSLVVSKPLRGHNYGCLMLKQALDSASDESDFLITIDCMPELIKYYQKMGFEEYRERTSGFYEMTDDEIEGVHMRVTKEKFDAAVLCRSIEKTMTSFEEMELKHGMKP